MSEKRIAAPGRKPAERTFKAGEFFQKYTMMIALVIVTAVFAMWPGKEGRFCCPPI